MAAVKKDRKTAVTLEVGGVIYPAGTLESDIEGAENIHAVGVFED